MYKKYFKMLRIGVHKGQVKLEQSDGWIEHLGHGPIVAVPNGAAAPLAIEDR